MMIKHGLTVRILLLIILLTFSIVAAGVFALKMLQSDSTRLEQRIKDIENSTKSGDWDQALKTLAETEEIWSEVKGYWAALIDHQEVDNIEDALSRLRSLIQSKNVSLTLSEAAVLKNYLDHIPEKEELKLENIM